MATALQLTVVFLGILLRISHGLASFPNNVRVLAYVAAALAPAFGFTV